MFEFSRPNGTKVKYDARTLAQYIVSSGDFLEPVSRVRFSEKDLLRLDYTVKCAGIKVESVVEAYRNREKYQEKANERDALMGVESCIGEIVGEMLKLIDAQCDMLFDPERAETDLVRSMFPVFTHYYYMLRSMDPNYAMQCLDQTITVVNGPPNKPNDDFMGFKTHVLRFLQLHRTCEYV